MYYKYYCNNGNNKSNAFEHLDFHMQDNSNINGRALNIKTSKDDTSIAKLIILRAVSEFSHHIQKVCPAVDGSEAAAVGSL